MEPRYEERPRRHGDPQSRLVQYLGRTLKKFKVPAHEQMELVAILGPMKREIVTR
jgi:hypothetical protein